MAIYDHLRFAGKTAILVTYRSRHAFVLVAGLAERYGKYLVQLRPAKTVAARLVRPFGSKAFQRTHNLGCMSVDILAGEELYEAFLFVIG